MLLKASGAVPGLQSLSLSHALSGSLISCYICEFQSNSNVLYLINCGNKSKCFLFDLTKEDPKIYSEEDLVGYNPEREWKDIPLPQPSAAEAQTVQQVSIPEKVVKKAQNQHDVLCRWMKTAGIDLCRDSLVVEDKSLNEKVASTESIGGENLKVDDSDPPDSKIKVDKKIVTLIVKTTKKLTKEQLKEWVEKALKLVAPPHNYTAKKTTPPTMEFGG